MSFVCDCYEKWSRTISVASACKVSESVFDAILDSMREDHEFGLLSIDEFADLCDKFACVLSEELCEA